MDSDGDRIFYVKVLEELSNWEYDYNTYKCLILSNGDYYNKHLILVTEMWTVVEATIVEIELL
jgi:hypothetical protein